MAQVHTFAISTSSLVPSPYYTNKSSVKATKCHHHLIFFIIIIILSAKTSNYINLECNAIMLFLFFVSLKCTASRPVRYAAFCLYFSMGAEDVYILQLTSSIRVDHMH